MRAKVIVEISAKAVDNEYIYNVPEGLINNIKVGVRVKVPFKNRHLEGFVLDLGPFECQYPIKDIIDIVDNDIILNKEMIILGKNMSKELLCSRVSAYQAMLPKALKASIKTNIKEKKVIHLKLNISNIEAKEYIKKISYHSQKEIINNLLENKELKINNLTSSMKTLIKKNIITLEYKEEYRYKIQNKQIPKEVKLTSEQTKASNDIVSSLNHSQIFVLFGVTGSGKTEVYISVIKEALSIGKTALILIPEISLTTQLVNRFHAHFENIAVLHSALSDSERYDEYRKIKNGEANIVIGTRSAVFAPLKNIGIIIIDEEQTTSFKQDSNPRYHARDISIFRSKYHSCPIVLGSATPSLESFARAANGVYKFLALTKRPGLISMPKINIVNMKKEAAEGNLILSKALQEKISIHLNKGMQIMLLLNRRGYSSQIFCRECGYTEKCPNCDITLTYHKTVNKLICHYCGYTKIKTNYCSNCNSKSIIEYGLGTEKLEEEVNKLIYGAKTIRMDLDTTTKKGSHEKIITSFTEKKYNILIGTQMIAKGLDFPSVTLVGVINADSSLSMPDFRSSERTFELLNQVSGRSGRSSEEGEVVIQTYNPESYTIKCASNHNYLAFYQKEMEIRKKLKYSPYYYITLVNIISKSYNDGLKESKKISNYLKNKLDKKTIVLGPSMANVFKQNNKYKYQCIIKYQKDDNLQETLLFIDNLYKANNQINIEIDINPLKL